MGSYVGTAGWSYPSGNGRWDGVFYPAGLPDRDKLTFYAQFFNAVELNSSVPSDNTTGSVATSLPPR